jgi:hypothetical protein
VGFGVGESAELSIRDAVGGNPHSWPVAAEKAALGHDAAPTKGLRPLLPND